MTFKIDIPQKEYANWTIYRNWTTVYEPFIDWFVTNSPDIISVSDLEIEEHKLALGLHRQFEFQSEEHYHWFLLQQ